ncbi:hypothetical protein CBW24_06230 [Pacificitalea manganoxidans]|uniref:PhiE125 gp8 family phage protein n=1 Tax=Pacificitalea manganoxidans TaxID=1411902 RepID=A0A291LYV1_9RHOB|nr:head-tail connector protein [Pacificitalea manganoxidans]ATI41635.1 hypothetical protein CBW24_06230 [Pacificitalea manganoxidans]MAQ44375.1 hypothetical protein [Actibacterium sp.]MDR6309077.1 putative phiE125 gp8 family phage protein [Pacificitalea manganoxidans]
MMLSELTTVPDAALPLARFREHLRLGSGFADAEAVEDGLIVPFLRAASVAVEAWTGKVLIERNFRWRLERWRGARVQDLPVAPVSAITALRVTDRLDWEVVVDPATWRLIPDTHRPGLAARGAALPSVPEGGFVCVDFTAGFGPDWDDLPADLAQAVMLLAAHYYEYRHEMRMGEGVMPYGVSALIERWRNMRLLAGGPRR